MIHYYVDPGSGFVFGQSTFFLWGMILGFFSAFLVFFRLFLGFFRKFFWLLCILVVILIIGGTLMHKSRTGKKVIILGIDAMDPAITEQLMQEGRLPNFSYLKEQGSFSRLNTTMPSESVVAWSSFATGLDPGDHAVFDFVMRDPDNYLLYLSLNEVKNLFGKIKVQNRRKGAGLWDILTKNNISSYIYFCPNTFPAQPLSGKMLSGMGVPDLSGTMGKFSFYTTGPLNEQDKESRGRVIHAEYKDSLIYSHIYGPKISSGNSIRESEAPLKIMPRFDEKGAVLEFQGKRFFLKESTWSDWQDVSFKIGGLRKAHGIVKFYLKSLNPEFQLYMSPVNFDPRSPLFPISYPQDYSKKLTKKIGLYYTQGMPCDTWALTENRLDESAFLEHVDEILMERKKILNEALKEFRGGLFFFYFDTLDAVQHTFWRYLDKQHALYEQSPLYQDTIFKYYEKMDQVIGEILKNIKNEDATLIVMSDHGFTSFRKSVHLNRWLLENHFLFLKPGAVFGRELLEDVDWHRTKAYALGFGGIYLNRAGREYLGTVGASEAKILKQDILDGLKNLKDPENGEAVVKNVYAQEEIFLGVFSKDAPDLFVGFNSGYRASWQTALGGTPEALIEDNRRKWSGDHLVDSTLVPGVVFFNKKFKLSEPNITDIAPTLLNLLNVRQPQNMRGKILLREEER